MKKKIKKFAYKFGADICGIAPIDRFDGAPVGFHPLDIYTNTKSVVVFAKKIPEGVFHSKSPIPYTAINDIILEETIRISINLSVKLECMNNLVAVPVPTEPYEYWDEKKLEGRGILSLKHAGYLAGIGVIGKNTLLTNKDYGNRILLGAVLLNIELEGDQIANYKFCTESCQQCINSCPANAIDGQTVNQKLCRDKSKSTTKKGYSLYICNECRKVCPYGTGIK